jgi:3-phenylpropionate/trans-cinnamate dioxygenase ferredoxin subunit
MEKHIVGTVAEIPPMGRKLVEVAGRTIGIFNLEGEFFALRNRCPHQGGPLCDGPLGSFIKSSGPGQYEVSRSGEMLRCPWHGWEFDVRSGQSWFDPKGVRVKSYEIEVVPGRDLIPPAPGMVPGPYVAESYPVTVEHQYIVLHL